MGVGGKDDVVLEEHSVLTIQPDVRILFKSDTEKNYHGLMVKGRWIADGASRSDPLFPPWTFHFGLHPCPNDSTWGYR